MLSRGRQVYSRLAGELASLAVGEWLIWHGAPPRKYAVRIRTIANRTGLNLLAYLDVDKRVIVQRLPDRPA